MRLKLEASKRTQNILKYVQALSVFFSALVAGALKANPNSPWFNNHPILKLYIDTCQNSAWWFIPVSALVLSAIQGWKRFFIKDTTWRVIHSLLDDFRNTVFDDSPEQHLHRVTLFQHKRFYFLSIFNKPVKRLRNPWSGWLVPIERSGNVTRNIRVLFWAPLDDPDKAEGFAGDVWKRRKCLYVSSLSDLSERPNEKNIKKYADRTKSDINYIRTRVKEGKLFALSYWGIHVEVDGEPWGVIVIDSRNQEIAKSDQIRQIFEPFGKCLCHLLKKQ